MGIKTYPKLYKRTSTGKIQEWEIFVEGDQFWTVSGQQDGKKIEHARTTCKGKNVGRSNETSPEAQAEAEAAAKWKKQTEKHYNESIDTVDSTAYTKVMLAKGYDKRPKDKIDWSNAFISPKLDGIRFVATANHSHSRNGKQMGGGNILRKQMDYLFENYPELITDGELYNHEFKDDFNSLVSLIKRDEAKIPAGKMLDIKQHLQYHIYDIPQIWSESKGKPYSQRFEEFRDCLEADPNMPPMDFLHFVGYERVTSHEDVLEKYAKHIEQGYEGSIIRFDLPYEGKRTWNLLKVKEFMDEEFVIVEVLEGKGKKAGTAGSLTMRLPSGKVSW